MFDIFDRLLMFVSGYNFKDECDGTEFFDVSGFDNDDDNVIVTTQLSLKACHINGSLNSSQHALRCVDSKNMSEN